MSDEAETQNEQQRSAEHDHPPYKFSVDGRSFESDQPVLSGAQIKARASIDPSFGLFLERQGHLPDQQISDSLPVDLRENGKEHFYTAPPAHFGSGT